MPVRRVANALDDLGCAEARVDDPLDVAALQKSDVQVAVRTQRRRGWLISIKPGRRGYVCAWTQQSARLWIDYFSQNPPRNRRCVFGVNDALSNVHVAIAIISHLATCGWHIGW